MAPTLALSEALAGVSALAANLPNTLFAQCGSGSCCPGLAVGMAVVGEWTGVGLRAVAGGVAGWVVGAGVEGGAWVGEGGGCWRGGHVGAVARGHVVAALPGVVALVVILFFILGIHCFILGACMSVFVCSHVQCPRPLSEALCGVYPVRHARERSSPRRGACCCLRPCRSFSKDILYFSSCLSRTINSVSGC